MNERSCDVLVVGGGIIGSCIAYNLVKLSPGLKVLVVERDFTYQRASCTLSLANIRTVGFKLKQNAQLALETLRILDRFEEEMVVDGEKPSTGFHREGNLLLADASGLEEAQSNYLQAKDLGANAEWLEPEEIHKRWPMLSLTDLEGATYAADNGHLDVYSLLMAYKKKALKLGVTFLEAEVSSLTGNRSKITGGRLASGEHIHSGITVNCTGAWAAELLKPLGIHLPVSPVRRQG
jgi:FAD-dependent oxidoreductase domain-containing protein 1